MQVCPFALTGNFNREVCGIPDPHFPTQLQPPRKEWTLAALREEVQEFQDATTIEDEVDALIDLIYFAAGRMYEMGVDGQRAFLNVHNCNMQKVRGETAKRPGALGHDAIKPDGWQPPDYGWLLAQVQAGHEQARQKRHFDLLSSLQIGDRVLANSNDPDGELVGIEATVVHIDIGRSQINLKDDDGVEYICGPDNIASKFEKGDGA